MNSTMRSWLLLGCLLIALLAGAGTAQAAAVIEVSGYHGPTVYQPGSNANVSFVVENNGDSSTAATPGDPLAITLELPAGVTTRVDGYDYPAWGEIGIIGQPWNCGASTETPGESSVTCTLTHSIGTHGGNLPPGQGKRFFIYVDVAPTVTGPLEVKATVSGAGIASVEEVEEIPVGAPVSDFGLEADSYEADAYDREGVPERRAGSRPFRAVVGLNFDTRNVDLGIKSGVTVNGGLRSLAVTLPRGFAGNPTAVAECTVAQLATGQGIGAACPIDSQIGTMDLSLQSLDGPSVGQSWSRSPLFNMVPPPGVLADFAFQVVGVPVHIRTSLDPTDYSVVTRVIGANETLRPFLSRATIWGVPGDPAHDPARWNSPYCAATGGYCDGFGASFEGEVKPFLNLPTQCGVADTTDLWRVDQWARPGEFLAPLSSPPAEVNGCDQLEFSPTVVTRPTTNVADAPTGLEFDLHIPQSEDPEGLATAHLRDAVVKLPNGMTVNPPSADGLSACSMAQVGIGADGVPNGNAVSCPDASKLGTVEAESPAVDHPMGGTVYLAEQNANPFGSLLAMYLVIEDPATGVLVKLPGKVDPDPNTGQLTATFRDNPQLPVEDIRLKFFEGPRAALKTPSTCGAHTTDATFTPWSAPEAASVEKSSSFELTRGPSGGECLPSGGSAPNNPAFSAGTIDPTAKAFSPFVLKLARADGSQQLAKIETTLPKGLVAKLAGTTYCSDAALSAAAGKSGKAEKSSASCPASSRVGSVNVGAGAGSTPLYVSGEAYLAGPYKGAPLSLAIVTPAVAGPFDLGTVVVRTALHVNPETAQVRAVSDELPTILQGIPLNIRSVALKMDRPQFILNPTSCNPMSVVGSALSVFNQSAALTNPFQVGECQKLGFKPKLHLRLSGKTTRSGHPKLKATLTMPPGNANIARAQVTLPKTQFLEQSHIRTICTRVQYAAKSCPKGAVYGYAKAWTPLLDQPLEGPVYLRSSSNKLPDLVADLNGQIEVDLVGRIDSPNAMIRNTFELVPDAPVSKFVLTMQGGKKSLLVNNTNLCKAKPRATVLFEAQNGKVFEDAPLAKADCGKKGRKGAKGKDGKKRGGGKR